MMDLEHVRYLTTEESSAECALMCPKGVKCKQRSTFSSIQ
jgi:hypothetical protein